MKPGKADVEIDCSYQGNERGQSLLSKNKASEQRAVCVCVRVAALQYQ